MKIRRERMSVEEYHLLPFHPGWKVEYMGGEAVFRPRSALATGALRVVPRPEPMLPGDVEFRAPTEAWTIASL